jgi:hypothetical protein
MGLFDNDDAVAKTFHGGFNFGTEPRPLSEHFSRMGMTRTERILHDGNPHEVNDLIHEGNNAAYRKGVMVGAVAGFLGLLTRYR